MTVNTVDVTAGPYAGNGVANKFDFDFRIQDKNQLIVYETQKDGEVKTLKVDTDYTVSGIGEPNGGAVTRNAGPLPEGWQWFIRSNYEPTQDTSFPSQGGFFPKVHEDAFDKLTMLYQQLSDTVKRRGLLFPDYVNRPEDQNTLPLPKPGQVLSWEIDGRLISSPVQNITRDVNLNDAIDTYDSVADFISKKPGGFVAQVTSYYGGWSATVEGPKGGFTAHKTGYTADSPSVGDPVAPSSIGAGVQAGLFWTADGAEWRAAVREVEHLDFSDMVADPSLHLGDTVRTLEHTSGYGYEGGNLYKIVAGGTGTHDNGSYIDLDNGLQAMGLFPGGVYRPEHWGAVGDGSTDDAVALLAMIAYAPPVYTLSAAYATTQPLDFPEGSVIIGNGRIPNYATFYVDPEDHPVRIVKTNKNTNGNYTVKLGRACQMRDVTVMGPQSYYETAIDGTQWLGRAGAYPADTNNPDYGIICNGHASRLERVCIMNFGEAGLYGDNSLDNNNVTTLDSVSITACKRGIHGTFYDSTIINPFVTQCVEANIEILGPATSIMGGRVEWAAFAGIRISGANFQIVGTVVDRNGGPGVWVKDTFGGTVKAYFGRNGAGGDGTNGRYGLTVSDAGHFAYRATDDLDSCNIKLDGAQVISTSGSRFRHGGPDSGVGAVSPAYNITLVDGAIPTTSNEFEANAGDGYSPAYPVTTGPAPGYFSDPAKAGDKVTRQPVKSQLFKGIGGGALQMTEFSVPNNGVHALSGYRSRYLYELLDSARSGHCCSGYKGFDVGAFLSHAGDFVYAGNNVLLDGATGEEGKISVSSAGNTLYVENRTGQTVTIAAFLRSSQ